MYEDGKLLKKKNTFTDFIDCSKFVIEQKYTSEKQSKKCQREDPPTKP